MIKLEEFKKEISALALTTISELVEALSEELQIRNIPEWSEMFEMANLLEVRAGGGAQVLEGK